MSETTSIERGLVSKVPEIALWFWVIKILCTTVGESVADWINVTLGVGLNVTAAIFTVILVAVLAIQLRLPKYVPFVYWLTVVVLSVTGTLYTDILTDSQGVPLAVSTTVFVVILAAVFGVWFAREGTLSIHSIVTVPRELFYWLAILVTFALGTAAGDWTLSLTGWGPGTSVLLPVGLIAAVIIGWRLGANVVLSFWLAYILTRPLGANLGDWFASPTSEHGLGIGTAITSVIFLLAILVTVAYLTVTRTDVIERAISPVAADPTRERILLGYFAVVAVATGIVLAWASAQPHSAPAAEGESGSITDIAPGQAIANFPAATVDELRGVTQATLDAVQAGNQGDASARATDLETLWDTDQDTLQPLDDAGWTAIDDAVLKGVRSHTPDPSTETSALSALVEALT